MWIFDKLFNRKIEGKSSLDALEPLAEKGGVDEYGVPYFENIPNGDGYRLEVRDDGVVIVIIRNGEPLDEYYLGEHGVDKVDPNALIGLTHSFDELDPVIKQIIVDAFAKGSEGVTCTQEQWTAIKTLLDKSLYINYDGDLMIKSSSNGTSTYVFGGKDLADNYGYSLWLNYDTTDNKLFGEFQEL